jgi:thioesterase domain-containing protein
LAALLGQRGVETPASPAAAPASLPAPEAGLATRSLVLIREGQSAPPFFCVHGMYGNVVILRDLAFAMDGSRAFYGLQQRGLNGVDAPHRSFEEMAAAYIEEIKAVQPQGPYNIGGYSGGGSVAFEMAHQLRAAGDEVAALVMLDTPGPLLVSDAPTIRVRRFLMRLRGGGISFLKARSVRFARNSAWKLRHPGTNSLQVGEETLAFHLGDVMIAAQRAYTFRLLDAPATLITATLRDRADGTVPAHLGWDGFASHLTVYPLQASHDNMCLGSNAQQLAQIIDRVLA